jgi:hypothetical protein
MAPVHPADVARARRLHDAAVRAYEEAQLTARAAARSPSTSAADVHAALARLGRCADRREAAEQQLVALEEALRYSPLRRAA